MFKYPILGKIISLGAAFSSAYWGIYVFGNSVRELFEKTYL